MPIHRQTTHRDIDRDIGQMSSNFYFSFSSRQTLRHRHTERQRSNILQMLTAQEFLQATDYKHTISERHFV